MQHVVQHVAEKKRGHYNLQTSDQVQTFVNYKTFAYLLRGRLEHFLEAGQPEEQHGLRPGRRLEEHFVTANLMLDKSDAARIPFWIISLDLSKAFDRVHWPALSRVPVDEGIPVHIVWICN